ncbi:MAG: diguanylate cyclase [Myxococcales bacterium]|jgi:diguanylate cyclase (GGDEF)-like protein|nr:diguanylate cyclase [Myxococcales bacterium]MBL0196188.1 diguanylate cyclase [Myxococcales bacterium]
MHAVDFDSEATSITNFSELQREIAARKRQALQAYLVVLTGSNVGAMHKLEAAETVLGRSNTADLRLTDDGISRRHARILKAGSDVVIEDLNSANGTMVNGELITQRVLKNGDKISIGASTVVRFSFNDTLDESFQQKMIEAALRDGLTRAYNKRYFLERLETEYAFAKRHHAELSLLLFDIDFFKKINDSRGHLAGDAVLMELSAVVQSMLRTEDVFARYGGEEFAVLARGTSLAKAALLAERVRARVEETNFSFEGISIPVTISVGVAGLPETRCDDAQQLVAGADTALYDSKRGGRNRVTLKDIPI